MANSSWFDLGSVEELKKSPLQQRIVEGTAIALSYAEGQFGAVSGICNHVGGPLGEGHLSGEYIVCPWHNWKFHRKDGQGEPGFEKDCIPKYNLKVENGRLWIDLEAASKRHKMPHAAHRLERPIQREPGAVRVVGISTAAMDPKNPRFSTSDYLLEAALDQAKTLGHETKLIKLNDLRFHHCGGYYSKAAQACTWPCSITQMDSKDQMEQVYEALVFWADVIVVSTSIRWGNASSLYYKMIERMNCIQNQVTIRDRVLIRNKVASFIITGGQDNIQAVAGQMMNFFSELGFHFPQFPFIAHSRGWTAEDMENNVISVRESQELKEGAQALVTRGIHLAEKLLEEGHPAEKTERGGRKAHPLES